MPRRVMVAVSEIWGEVTISDSLEASEVGLGTVSSATSATVDASSTSTLLPPLLSYSSNEEQLVLSRYL